MDKRLSQLLDESIKLELKIGDLYLSFSRTFTQDREFWFWLAQEENNHAALLKSAKLEFVDAGYFPSEMLNSNLNSLIKSNQQILDVIKRQKQKVLSRAATFKMALKIEGLAGEVDFHRAIEKEADSPALKLFQKLNRDDKNHARRIRKYMRQKGIGE